MAKENKDVTAIENGNSAVDSAIDSVLDSYDENSEVVVEFRCDSVRQVHGLGRFGISKRVVYHYPTVYPLSVTDQVHCLSLAEQIKRGQGQMDSPENNKANYTFPDGRDDGSEAVNHWELSEPAVAYEKEIENNDSIKSQVKTQLQEQADKAQKASIEKAQQEALKSLQNQKADDKSSTNAEKSR